MTCPCDDPDCKNKRDVTATWGVCPVRVGWAPDLPHVADACHPERCGWCGESKPAVVG